MYALPAVPQLSGEHVPVLWIEILNAKMVEANAFCVFCSKRLSSANRLMALAEAVSYRSIVSHPHFTCITTSHIPDRLPNVDGYNNARLWHSLSS